MDFKLELKKREAPLFWKEFAKRYGVEGIWFMDDQSMDRSMIIGHIIMINLRCEDISGYKKILEIDDYEEVLTCKLLHEIAHVIKGHYIAKLKYSRICLEDVCRRKLEEIMSDPFEKEAWEFVCKFKNENYELFRALVEELRAWFEENRK